MHYDLEERTLRFTQDIIRLCREIKQDAITMPLISQVVRSAGAVGANYIEANEKLGQKDFILRLKIACKEAKESVYWLKCLTVLSPDDNNIEQLVDECSQINKILSPIIYKNIEKSG